MGQTTVTFAVAGMHCASCGILIDETLDDLDGVTSSTTNVRAGRTTVILDPAVCGPDTVAAAIGGVGAYTARPDTP